MKDLYEKNKHFFALLAVVGIGFLVWYFSSIVSYILIAMALSILGNPLVALFDKIRFGRSKFPHVLSTILTLVVLLVFFIAFFSFFIPVLITEIKLISSINMDQLSGFYHRDLIFLQEQLIFYGILPPDGSLVALIQTSAMNIINSSFVYSFFTDLFSFTGTFLFGLFSILFITFFFLFDSDIPKKIVLSFIPDYYHPQTSKVFHKSKKLLSRYFAGIFFDTLAMIVTYSIGFLIIGVDGALVIAFFAGIINIIPYLGPLIATFIGLIIGITSTIAAGHYDLISHHALMIVIVFVVAIVIDNVVYQPLIYGKSVKAHPLEIFLVIIAAGSIGGIIGMIIAVPAYTFLRIIAKEFLSQFKLVRSLTDKI